MSKSPAEVIRAALVEGELGVLPSGAGNVAPVWPVYVGALPETPDNAVCIYDMEGEMDGRLMRTADTIKHGETINHPGWQVRVRAVSHPIGYTKIKEIQQALDQMRNLGVAINGTAYTIRSITQRSGILSLGEEPNAKRRNGFTLNGTITHEEVPE